MTTATLMVILAHPDDETFSMGGTLAKAAAEGKRVHLITATRGELGISGKSIKGDPESETQNMACHEFFSPGPAANSSQWLRPRNRFICRSQRRKFTKIIQEHY